MSSHFTTHEAKTNDASFTPAPRGLLQRKCACGGASGISGHCEDCNQKRLVMQRRATSQDDSAAVPPIVHETLRSPGQALDMKTRTFMESRFGHDFSRVRVHTDERAAESAQAVNALAYTVGRDVVFGEGQYAPDTREGRKLLAHELAHVAQQRQANPMLRRQAISASGDAHATATEEDEAEEIAEAVEESAAESEFARDERLTLFRKPKGKKVQKKKKKPKRKKAASSPLTAAQVKSYITSNNKSSVSTELLLCQIWKESGFDPNQKTGSHVGFMQMYANAVKDVNNNTPKGTHYKYSEMTDPAKNIQCGTYYLQMRINREGGDVKKGLEGFGTGVGYADNILVCESCVQNTPAKTDDCLKAIHP
jgi:soluble lytic murein transglycosylase-like protein